MTFCAAAELSPAVLLERFSLLGTTGGTSMRILAGAAAAGIDIGSEVLLLGVIVAGAVWAGCGFSLAVGIRLMGWVYFSGLAAKGLHRMDFW